MEVTHLYLILSLGLGVGGNPVNPPDLGEHGAVPQREPQVEQPVGGRTDLSEPIFRDLKMGMFLLILIIIIIIIIIRPV